MSILERGWLTNICNRVSCPFAAFEIGRTTPRSHTCSTARPFIVVNPTSTHIKDKKQDLSESLKHQTTETNLFFFYYPIEACISLKSAPASVPPRVIMSTSARRRLMRDFKVSRSQKLLVMASSAIPDALQQRNSYMNLQSKAILTSTPAHAN